MNASIKIVLLTVLLECRYVFTKPYDFVFGWSTGHVGPTTLSSSITYGNPPNVKFIFEGERNPVFLRSLKVNWKNFTHDDEYKFVKDHFIPVMLDYRGNATTLVDLGHQNLYFIHGLLQYFKENEDNYKVLFIRIRRERYESALSLTYNHANQKHESLCGGLFYLYCPHDRVNDIILKPPSPVNDWMDQSTEYQKALWMIDETEARWQMLIIDYPLMNRCEVYWSSNISNSINQAAYNISIAMQLNLSFESIQPVHLKVHASHKNIEEQQQQLNDQEFYRELDDKYQIYMNGNCTVIIILVYLSDVHIGLLYSVRVVGDV